MLEVVWKIMSVRVTFPQVLQPVPTPRCIQTSKQVIKLLVSDATTQNEREFNIYLFVPVYHNIIGKPSECSS